MLVYQIIHHISQIMMSRQSLSPHLVANINNRRLREFALANNMAFFEEDSSTEFKVQDGDKAAHWSSRTVQTAHANKRSHRAFSCGKAEEVRGGGGAAGPALNMGKFGERGRKVKKSQQESSLDDRRNLISKIHKSPSEGRRIMGTMEASVRVNTDLLLAIKWIGPSC